MALYTPTVDFESLFCVQSALIRTGPVFALGDAAASTLPGPAMQGAGQEEVTDEGVWVEGQHTQTVMRRSHQLGMLKEIRCSTCLQCSCEKQ